MENNFYEPRPNNNPPFGYQGADYPQAMNIDPPPNLPPRLNQNLGPKAIDPRVDNYAQRVEEVKEEQGKNLSDQENYNDRDIVTNDLGLQFWYCKGCLNFNPIQNSCEVCRQPMVVENKEEGHDQKENYQQEYKDRDIVDDDQGNQYWYCKGCLKFNPVQNSCEVCRQPMVIENKEGHDQKVNYQQEYKDRDIVDDDQGNQYWYCKGCVKFNPLQNLCEGCRQGIVIDNKDDNHDQQENYPHEYKDREIVTDNQGYQFWYCKDCLKFNPMQNSCEVCRQPMVIENKEGHDQKVNYQQEYNDRDIVDDDQGNQYWYCKGCQKFNPLKSL